MRANVSSYIEGKEEHQNEACGARYKAGVLMQIYA